MSRLPEILHKRLVSDFEFSNGHPTHFWKSQWESFDIEDETTHGPSKWFLLYRFIYCLTFVTALIYSTNCQSELYFIFLTNWSYLFQTAYSVITFFMLMHEWAQRNLINKPSRTANLEIGVSVELNAIKVENGKNKSEKVPEESEAVEIRKRTPVSINISQKVIWVMASIVYLLPYGVAGGYWLVVYNPNTVNSDCEKFRSHYIYHGMVTVMALLDMMVSAVRIKLFHCIFPTVVVAVYCVFTYIYEAAGGQYREDKEFIYSVLNWKRCPLRAFATSLVAVIVITPLSHFLICYSIYKLRRWIFNKTCKSLE